MKKRSIALVLLVAMVMTMLPTAVVAEEYLDPQAPETVSEESVVLESPAEATEAAPTAEEGHSHTCEGCKDEAEVWTAWDNATELPNTDGHYYLTADVTLSAAKTIASGTVTLCLNGHTVKQTTANRIYYVNGGILNITDCTGEITGYGYWDGDTYVLTEAIPAVSTYDTFRGGIITGGNRSLGAAVNVGRNSVFNLYGGNLAGNSCTDKGGAIVLSVGNNTGTGGVFNMYGGRITGNKSPNGGAVYGNGGTTVALATQTNIYGGTIDNNRATTGGGALYGIDRAKITVTGATLAGNEAKQGGAIYLGEKATAILTGARIQNNEAAGHGSALIAVSNNTVTATGTTFSGNVGTAGEGTVRLTTGTTAAFTDCTFANNRAVNCSALQVTGTAKVTLTDTVIKDNVATSAGGFGAVNLGNASAVLTLTGATVIYGNKTGHATTAGDAHNLHLQNNGGVVNMDGLTAGAKVGITLLKARLDDDVLYFTTDIAEGADPLSYCVSDNGAYTVARDGAKLTLAPAEEHTCDGQTLTPWNKVDSLPAEGNYYLVHDVTLEQTHTVTGTLTLCLNGHTVTGPQDAPAVETGEDFFVILTSCSGQGRIQGAVASKAYTSIENISVPSVELLSSGIFLEGSTQIQNLHITGNNKLYTVNVLTQDASVGISVDADRTEMVLCDQVIGNPADRFTCLTAGYSISVTGGKLMLEKAHVHCVAGCQDCDHEKQEYTKWTSQTSLPTQAGYYFLANDVSLYGNWEAPDGVVLCLNGHTVRQGAESYRIVNVAGTATLTDCTGTGKLQGSSNSIANGGIAFVYKGGVLNLYGGTLTGGVAASGGGAVLLQGTNDGAVGGTLNLYGGAITGNTADQGGAVYVNSYAVLNIQGGSITNNTATSQGGAIRVAANSKTTIGAVTFTGNTAGSGSVLYIGGNNATVTLDGTTVTGNPVTAAGAIAKTNGSLLLKGATKIYDNLQDGAQMNLYLSGNNTLAAPELTEGARIGISVVDSRENMAFTATVTGDPSGYFSSDNTDYSVELAEGKLTLTQNHIHCVENCTACDHGTVTFQKWTATDSLPTKAGAYYLATDVVLTDAWTVEGEITLCLAGHTVTQTKAATRIANVKGTLNLTDCTGSGKLQGGQSVSNGGIVNVFKGGTVNLYAGTLTGGVATSGGGAVLLQGGTADAPGGILNMYGGAITGNKAVQGGAVYVNSYTTLNVQGGQITNNTATDQGGFIRVAANSNTTIGAVTVTGNTAPKGSAIYMGGACNVTLDGTTVTGNPVTDLGAIAKTNGTLTLKGAVKITGNNKADGTPMNLYLSGNNKLAVPALTEGAEVAVSFAADRTDLAITPAVEGDPTGYFTSDNENYLIKLIDGKVSLTSKHKHCVWGCEACDHEVLSFQDWTSTDSLPTQAGAYCLTNDVTLNGPWTVSKNIVLCLNGHTVTQGKAAARLITLSAGTLTVTDCNGSGKLQGRDDLTGVGGIINVYKGTTFNLYAGTLTGAKTTDAGGAVFLQAGSSGTKGGTFHMYGGAITGNTGAEGGAIYVHDYTELTVTGGTIADNTATKQGGALRVNKNATVSLENITLSGNSSADTGAIYVGGSDCTVALKNVTVTGSHSEKNGAVTMGSNTATLLLAGATQISDNRGANLYLLSGAAKAVTFDILTEGARIGVSLSKTRIYDGDLHFSTELAEGVDPSGYCFSDDSVYQVAIAENRLVLDRLPQPDDHVHCLYGCESDCGHAIYRFAKLEEDSLLPATGCYYLTTDVTLSAVEEISKDLHLCLNGHTVKQTKGRVFAVNNGGLLTVSDCTARENLLGTYKAGTLTGGSNTFGGFMNLRRGGTFQLYDGIITGNQAPESTGGAIYIQGGNATEPGGIFQMYGGELSGNTATTGAAIGTGAGGADFENCRIELYGGTVCDNEATASGGAIYGADFTVIKLGKVTVRDNKAGKNAGAIGGSHTGILMDGAIIENNEATGNGGGFYLTGKNSSLTVESGTVCGNTAVNGGGILLEAASTLTLKDGTFCHNKTTDDGGAIYASINSVLDIQGGTVTENEARNGGGIYGLRTGLTVTGGSVRKNTARKSGGGMYLAGTAAELGVFTVTGNESGENGAGIMAANAKSGDTTYSSHLTVGGTVIMDNTAKASGGGLVLSGAGTKATVKDINVSGNTAGVSAGGIFLFRAAADIQGGLIENNESTKGGGGIFVQGGEATLGESLIIRKNNAGGNGGGISIARASVTAGEEETFYPSTVTVSGTQITNNTAKGNGGGLYVAGDGTEVTVERAKINNNKATHGGGAIVESKAELTLKSGSVNYNTSKTAGGGLYISTGCSFRMTGGSVSGNSSGGGGGIYFLRSKGTLSGGSISGNSATKSNAGGVYVTGSNVTLGGVTISGNSAKKDGGGVCTASTKDKKTGITYYPTLTMTGGKISENTAHHGAGVLSQSKEGVFTLRGGEIVYNKGTGNGAGIYSSTNTTFYMHGGTVAYNEGKYGAGIYQSKVTATYTGGEIHHNTALKNGGGMSITATCTVDMENVSIHDNSSENGGGMVVQSTDTVLTAKNCQFYGNAASLTGGFAYLSNNVTASFEGCTFENNKSQGSAGAVFSAAPSIVTVKDCSFTGNEALKNGGAIQVRGTMYMDDCLIENNKAAECGGGIAAGKMGATGMGIVPGLVATNTTVRNNEATLQGGGIYLALGSKAELTGLTVTGNTAGTEGSGIWAVDDLVMRDLTVTGNTSDAAGHALYLGASEYDNHSYFIGVIKMSGDMKVLDNKGGDLFLGEKTTLTIDYQGLGKNTDIRLMLDSGLLTQRLYGAYNYELRDGIYTVTYGDRSLTDPEELPEEATQPDGQPDANKPNGEQEKETASPVLWLGIAGGVVLLAVLILILALAIAKSKKKAAQQQ